MLAVLGAVVQANYTHTGPIDNLLAHLADPGHNTIFALSNVSESSFVDLIFSEFVTMVCNSFGLQIRNDGM